MIKCEVNNEEERRKNLQQCAITTRFTNKEENRDESMKKREIFSKKWMKIYEEDEEMDCN